MARQPNTVTVDLRDIWIVDGTSVRNDGDGAKIDALLADELIKIAVKGSGWCSLYRHRNTGVLWELSYPQSDTHGGGPRRLRELSVETSEQWLTS